MAGVREPKYRDRGMARRAQITPAARETRFELDRLLSGAWGALDRSYAPYSRFAVGAALLDSRGRIWTGANVENASYPLGICAERNALLAWKSGGGSRLVAIAIVSGAARPTPPCGLCRDALRHHAARATVYLATQHEVSGPYLAAEWLPGLVDR